MILPTVYLDAREFYSKNDKWIGEEMTNEFSLPFNVYHAKHYPRKSITFWKALDKLKNVGQ